MGLLDPPAQTAQSAKRVQLAQGWSLVSTRSNMPNAVSTSRSVTDRCADYMPFPVVAVRLVYANWYTGGTGETPFQNAIKVRAGVQPGNGAASNAETATGLPVYPVTFGGRPETWIESGGFAVSDPLQIALPAGRFFTKSYASGPTASAPPAPTLATATSGGQLSAGTRFISITYVYANGEETTGSATTSIATTGSASTITITAPTNPGGAVGWKVYSGSSTAYQVTIGTGTLPFGTDYVMTTEAINDNSVLLSLPRVIGGAASAYPQGLRALGTLSSSDGLTNGDGHTNARDCVNPGLLAVFPGSTVAMFSPIAILGIAADGTVHSSLAIIGDSIPSATGDYGFNLGGAAWGGYAVRAAIGQTANRTYSQTKTPPLGLTWLSTGGEAAAPFADNRGIRRSAIAGYATTVTDDYGTNDLSVGTTASVIASYILTIAARFTGRGQKYIRTTLTPRATSTDGYATLANQSVPALLEAYRRQLNAWILRTTGQATITGEAMAAGYAAALTSAANLYGGGNGTATTFVTRNIFVQGTETITVAGTTKTPGTDYTYLGTITTGGITYASGVLFGSAPANGAAVLATYTAAAGFRVLAGASTDVWDTAATVEINAAGTAGTNGGWWKLKSNSQLTSTATGGTTLTLVDSTRSWTVNQWAGYCVVTNNQVRQIISNTATTLTIISPAFAAAPANGDAYEICDSASADGTHPTTPYHQLMAAACDLTKVA